MKILAIRLKNLASLAGPFELDFTAEPLASAGLFAITGPTGAGKSTLLDALCLALFGAIPRLNNIGQSKVPEIDGDISTNDPRTLLRRGTGSGYAEVDFVGIDNRRYRARWETNRARDNASKKLQASRQTLIDLDSEQVLSSQNKTEYKTMLEARLGLNFEQFTRAVMLAQSEFSAFLKADDKERSELLEKLTDTAIYSQLGRRAYSKSNEAKKAHDDLKSLATGITPLEPEARADLDKCFDEAQQQLKAQQAQFRQLELQQQWLKVLVQLRNEHQSAAQQLTQDQLSWDSQSAERLNFSRLENLAPQRHQFARQTELNSQISPLAAKIQQHLVQQTAQNTQQDQLEKVRLDAQSAALNAQQQLTEAKPRLQQAFDTQGSVTRLIQEMNQATELKQQAKQKTAQGQRTLGDLLEQQQRVAERLELIAAQLEHSAGLAPLSAAWDIYHERLKQLMQIGGRLNKGTIELPQLEQSAASANQQLTEQRNTLELLYREAGAQAHAVGEQIQILGSLLQDNRKQQRAFEDLSRLWATQQQLDQRVLELTHKQQEAQQQREQLNREGLQAKSELTNAEHTLSVTRQLLERQRMARSASVEELRGQLQNDQPCPVCGSHEHPYHQPEALLQSLTKHDESEEANALKIVDTLKDTLVDLRATVAGLIAQQKEFLQQQEQLATQQQALAPNFEAHPLSARLLEQDLAKRDNWLTQHLNQLAQNIAQDEQRQNALLTLQKDAAYLQQQLQIATQSSQAATQQLADQHRQLASDRTRLEEELAAFDTLLPTEILDALRTQATTTVMQLDQQVTQRLQQLEQQGEEQLEQRNRQHKIELEQAQQTARVQEQEKLQQHCAALADQQQVSQQQLSELLGEHPSAEHWQQQLEQAVEHTRHAESTAGQALQDSRNVLTQLSAELKSEQDRLNSIELEHRELSLKIAEWRSRHPELDDSGLAQLLSVDDEQVNHLRQQLHHSEKAVEQAKVLLHEREQRLQIHQAQHEGTLDAERLDSALAQLHSQTAIGEQRCAELRAQQADDQRRQDANQALSQQIAEAYVQFQRWARLATLIGSAEGDKFRKIAQAYNLDLLVHHANAQLRQLVRRYRLKRGGSMLGLLVMDTEMGDELRSVHSLSGGETFLVSLALALGLASMASSTLKIESLFIDEGFGSLDPESLQLAMDALDGLQAQGRKVGVISHVQEMHERIPVQIQVRRKGNGLSTIEVSAS
ncbi:AAA family ATPase [Pseudomonas sp. 10B1]|uniref:AAA family ATPase n=1 Tax=unclassified Pseudomonas TaxID=196821 RepID=UPI002B230C97|nr:MULTISPECIES: AAA family ATPase [unclassified Pseudomonas]MEA9996636.1 AAA family ATPase [Pseudomonas sp. AA4]MEB0087935.1 AAA family ATPase [Pseudomonas sp. RTI1]MEB0128122.1 AAA family ATPase [Pseudomonas sp. CCC1.2]MEB0155754.1 AAA family ATPase [Pseudomonas sp. CCC4.3]MEB0222034.1 AAA family ATPase [Pseudomonas sp. AB12(2023)]